jgi:hypothetical protein
MAARQDSGARLSRPTEHAFREKRFAQGVLERQARHIVYGCNLEL